MKEWFANCDLYLEREGETIEYLGVYKNKEEARQFAESLPHDRIEGCEAILFVDGKAYMLTDDWEEIDGFDYLQRTIW